LALKKAADDTVKQSRLLGMQPMAASGHGFHFGRWKQRKNDLPVLFKDVI
jgi:hypothetical protein